MTNPPSIQRLDRWALLTGVCGFASVVTGVACISGPLALIVAGVGLMGWSYLMARAVARAIRPSEPAFT